MRARWEGLLLDKPCCLSGPDYDIVVAEKLIIIIVAENDISETECDYVLIPDFVLEEYATVRF